MDVYHKKIVSETGDFRFNDKEARQEAERIRKTVALGEGMQLSVSPTGGVDAGPAFLVLIVPEGTDVDALLGEGHGFYKYEE